MSVISDIENLNSVATLSVLADPALYSITPSGEAECPALYLMPIVESPTALHMHWR